MSYDIVITCSKCYQYFVCNYGNPDCVSKDNECVCDECTQGINCFTRFITEKEAVAYSI